MARDGDQVQMEMETPQASITVPTVTEIRKKLHYGDSSLARCQTFYHDVRIFIGKFVTSKGLEGTSLIRWKSEDHQRGLDELVDAYLDRDGNGRIYWPDDPASPKYNGLQYSKHRSHIRLLLKQLCFRLNQNLHRNLTYKHKRGYDHLISSQSEYDGSKDNPIDVNSIDESILVDNWMHVAAPAQNHGQIKLKITPRTKFVDAVVESNDGNNGLHSEPAQDYYCVPESPVPSGSDQAHAPFPPIKDNASAADTAAAEQSIRKPAEDLRAYKRIKIIRRDQTQPPPEKQTSEIRGKRKRGKRQWPAKERNLRSSWQRKISQFDNQATGSELDVVCAPPASVETNWGSTSDARHASSISEGRSRLVPLLPKDNTRAVVSGSEGHVPIVPLGPTEEALRAALSTSECIAKPATSLDEGVPRPGPSTDVQDNIADPPMSEKSITPEASGAQEASRPSPSPPEHVDKPGYSFYERMPEPVLPTTEDNTGPAPSITENNTQRAPPVLEDTTELASSMMNNNTRLTSPIIENNVGLASSTTEDDTRPAQSISGNDIRPVSPTSEGIARSRMSISNSITMPAPVIIDDGIKRASSVSESIARSSPSISEGLAKLTSPVSEGIVTDRQMSSVAEDNTRPPPSTLEGISRPPASFYEGIVRPVPPTPGHTTTQAPSESGDSTRPASSMSESIAKPGQSTSEALVGLNSTFTHPLTSEHEHTVNEHDHTVSRLFHEAVLRGLSTYEPSVPFAEMTTSPFTGPTPTPVSTRSWAPAERVPDVADARDELSVTRSQSSKRESISSDVQMVQSVAETASSAEQMKQPEPSPPVAPKPTIVFSYRVIHSRTPYVLRPWIPKGRFREKSLSVIEQEIPLEFPPEAKGWLFTLLGPGVDVVQRARRGQENEYRELMKLFDRLVRGAIPKNTGQGYLHFVIEIEAMMEEDYISKKTEEYEGDLDW